jgi:hypothetical protein
MNWYFSAGDSPFFFPDQLGTLSFLPQAWIDSYGFGQSAIPRLWIDYPFHLITFLLSRLGLSWFVIDKIWWLGIIFLGVVSAYRLGRLVFSNKKAGWLFSLFYCFNSYTLMIFDGGQLGVLLGLASLPFVLTSVYHYLTKPNLLRALIVSLTLALLLAVDLRTFIIAIPLILSMLIVLVVNRRFKLHASVFLIPIILMSLHAYWLFPLIQYPAVTSSYQQFSGSASAGFFSFADFSHSFSLLHPNWPENLFGKVSFFRWQFLLIPLVAFAVLVRKKIPWQAQVGVILVIVGAFLAKGVQEPFIHVYSWFMGYIPGFSLFRDPTKWYLYTILGFGILLTLSLKSLRGKILIPLLILAGLWLYHPLFYATVRGNIRPLALPKEAIKLQQFIRHQPVGQSLWLPDREQYSYQTQQHPSLIATDLFAESSAAGIIRALKDSSQSAKLSTLGIGIIIVPPDYRRKLFLDHYQFQPQQRQALINALTEQNLTRINQFQDYAVFVTQQAAPRVKVVGDSLFFQQQFDPYWRLKLGSRNLIPTPTQDGLMQFGPIDSAETYQLEYLPQQAANRGAIWSGISLVVIVALVMRLQRYAID